MTRRPYGPCTSPNRVGVGIAEGMGKETGLPSIMALGQPPAALSKPFRLKMIFTVALVWFTASRGLGHRLGIPANLPSIVAPFGMFTCATLMLTVQIPERVRVFITLVAGVTCSQESTSVVSTYW